MYSISEAASLLDIHPNTLRRWEAAGKVNPVYTLGGQRRFTHDEINRIRCKMGLPNLPLANQIRKEY